MGGGSAKRKEQFARSKLTKDTLAEISNENGGDRDSQRDFETRSVRSAQSVLSQVQSLRGIHSARSLAALTKGVAKEMGDGQMPTIHESKKPFVPPKIVIVDDCAFGIMKHVKLRLNRCQCQILVSVDLFLINFRRFFHRSFSKYLALS